VRPDLTCLGKIIGGGLPVGAYGGPSEIMDLVAPLGPMYQAGTLSGNPLAMAAGYATLRHLRDHKDIYTKLDKLAAEVVAGVSAAAKDAGVTMCDNRVGSMFTWFFTPGPVTDWTSAAKSDTEAFGRFFRAMLENGIYLPPSQFEAAFVGAAHTEQDVQQTIAAARQSFAMAHA
jgi:glutamate-1-semialdehyde 2,1-aminomutase